MSEEVDLSLGLLKKERKADRKSFKNESIFFSSLFLTIDLFLVAFFMTIIYINLGLKICLSYNWGLTSLTLEELLNINMHFLYS